MKPKSNIFIGFKFLVNLSKSVETGLNQIQLVSVLKADENYSNMISV